jgi:hypothetical protein
MCRLDIDTNNPQGMQLELSYRMHKAKTDKKMRLLGMDTCSSLNDIMEIRCNTCTGSEQGYDF